MAVDFVRGVCGKLPHVTEQVQWGADLVFKIGGKMFAVTAAPSNRRARLHVTSMPHGVETLHVGPDSDPIVKS